MEPNGGVLDGSDNLLCSLSCVQAGNEDDRCSLDLIRSEVRDDRLKEFEAVEQITGAFVDNGTFRLSNDVVDLRESSSDQHGIEDGLTQ